ncbi:SLC13 family permease [Humisphaera borealis]|uniref:DASS family sodium-coupled anion symporter n=1 Tax=Humisphaera borealis TaxID=2807512 RepID=A0A7M2WZE7_9BACT|nr:DASS family sodium-coupled anion symporter [Humisphaera borealis]QOV90878.1 DASS family sodium-coupled anion symporter [Humisphaera borealis]
MADESDEPRPRFTRPTPGRWAALAALLASIALPLLLIDDPRHARATAIAGACLVLWMSEIVPLFATTLLLLAATPLLLGPLDPAAFSLGRVMGWGANPVMALFFGGFTLSLAASKCGLDRSVAALMVHCSRGSQRGLLAAVMIGTALMSMWMSNIAAGAMMIVTLRPLFPLGAATSGELARFRQAVLLGVAFAANFGGMATPIGSGPNLIAIGAVRGIFAIDFAHWIAFALPLTMFMVAVSWVLLVRLHGVSGPMHAVIIDAPPLGNRGRAVMVLLLFTIAAWLTEPLHHVPSGVIAIALAGTLFAVRLLEPADLKRIEWDTLMLIAGGLSLGELLDKSGIAHTMAGSLHGSAMPDAWLLLGFIVACALISAVASNTAASAMLIQIGLGISPTASFAVLVALAASMGVPFVISTPPNAIAYNQGGLRPRDLMIPGFILMAVGCALLALTGRFALRTAGVP